METHCDMKGFLSFLVLRLISKKERSGEDITKEMEKRKGCRPSPGTIYPVLKYLNKNNLIQEIKDGKKEKKYKITNKGLKELKLATKKFVRLFYDLKEEF